MNEMKSRRPDEVDGVHARPPSQNPGPQTPDTSTAATGHPPPDGLDGGSRAGDLAPGSPDIHLVRL